jgi:hypothetical protein
MTRSEILSLITQAAAALTTEPQTPAQWTEEDQAMLRDIHAAVVAQKRTVAVPTVAAEIQTALTVQEVPMPSIPPSLDVPVKKKGIWGKLGKGLKTAVAGIAFGAGGGALGAVVDAVKDGNVNPGSLLGTAAIAAITGAVGYYQKPPADKEE